jgi:hypothetical protein
LVIASPHDTAALVLDIVGIYGGSAGSGGKLVKPSTNQSLIQSYRCVPD